MMNNRATEMGMMSRQRRWQLKQRELGNCVKCGDPKVTAQFCEYHAAKRVGYSGKFAKKPGQKAKQKSYDRQYNAKQSYGPFWECQVLLLTISDEIRRRQI